MVRILGEPSTNRRQRPCLQQTGSADTSNDTYLPPPAYSTVLPMHQSPMDLATESNYNEIEPRVIYNSQTHRCRTLEILRRKPASNAADYMQPRTTTTLPSAARRQQPITAIDVAQILRPTQQQRTASLGECVDQVILNTLRRSLSRSAETLVLNAVPPGESSFVDLSNSNDNENLRL